MSEETKTGDQEVVDSAKNAEAPVVQVAPVAKVEVAPAVDPNKGWRKRVDRQAKQIRELSEKLAERERRDAEQAPQVPEVDLKKLTEDERVQHLVQRELRRTREVETAQVEQNAFLTDITEKLETASEVARKEIPDYDDVVNPDRQVMIESDAVLFIANSDVGGYLRYELMKNAGLVKTLNALPESVRQSRLIRLESDIINKLQSNGQGQARSQGQAAPTPPSATRGNASAAPITDPNKMPMKEFRVWFQAQKDKKRK